MRRLTVKDLKKAIRYLPDNTIVCLYGDSEGNTQSTALTYYYDMVGKEHLITEDLPEDQWFKYIGGEDMYGIDQEKDKDTPILILVPSL